MASDRAGIPATLSPDHAWTDRLASWRVYAAAAGATLAAASSAEANIVYVNPVTKPDAKLNVNATTFQIDGVDIQFLVTNASAFVRGFAMTVGAGSFFFGAVPAVLNSIKNYNPGSAIVGGTRLNMVRAVTNFDGYMRQYGQFVTGQPGYAGFQLPASKGGGLGWLRIEVLSQNNNGVPDELRAIDWAYNDAGGGITAGEGIASDVPEPGTLALSLLASGAVGVLSWRKRRAALKATEQDPA